MTNRFGAPAMAFLERQRVARTGDDSRVAVGRRLHALRVAYSISADHLGSTCYQDAHHILDAEAGKIMPCSGVPYYFWQRWRIPTEFLTEGRMIDLIPASAAELRIFALLSRS